MFLVTRVLALRVNTDLNPEIALFAKLPKFLEILEPIGRTSPPTAFDNAPPIEAVATAVTVRLTLLTRLFKKLIVSLLYIRKIIVRLLAMSSTGMQMLLGILRPCHLNPNQVRLEKYQLGTFL
jgi:hypothetical protein